MIATKGRHGLQHRARANTRHEFGHTVHSPLPFRSTFASPWPRRPRSLALASSVASDYAPSHPRPFPELLSHFDSAAPAAGYVASPSRCDEATAPSVLVILLSRLSFFPLSRGCASSSSFFLCWVKILVCRTCTGIGYFSFHEFRICLNY